MTHRPITSPKAHETLERVADAILDHHQATAADLAAETGLTQATLRRYIRELELTNRAHRVRPLGMCGPNGGIWAPGAAPRDDDGPATEPIHLVVKHWRAGRANHSPLENHFFGRHAAQGAYA